MTNSIHETEQSHLNDILQRIEKAQAKTEADIVRTKNDQADVDQSWNDIRVKTNTFDGLIETAMSVRQQQQLLAEREANQSQAERRLATLGKLSERPYFARIDFREGGRSDAEYETIYIGLASFSEKNDFLVYDWRAPIASIYYDGGLGDVSYLTPDGKESAHVKLKRQFQIEDGIIVTIFDTDEAVGDQMLLSALSGESSTKMKSIVTTIQKEQNKIIRNTDADLLFVQGAAGSGKTAAVLQRVAYLLYRYRGKITSSQVILFSPNQLFNDYIDQVLPELGEQNMVQLTYYQYANRRLPQIEVETLRERFEEDDSQVAAAIANLKGSLQLSEAMKVYANSLGQKGLQIKPIKFQGKDLFSADQIRDVYYGFNDSYRLGQRLDGVREYFIKRLNGRIGSEMKADWVEEAIQNLSKEEYDAILGERAVQQAIGEEDTAADATRRAHGFDQNPRQFESDEAENKFLARHIVTQAFRPIGRRIQRNHFINVNAQFLHFIQQIPNLLDVTAFGLTVADWQQEVDRIKNQLAQKHLSLADTSIFLYLYDLITGKHGETDIRFIFIDEIQDYTPFQLAFLKFSFPRARFTMLGDLNQAIFTKSNANSLQDNLKQLFANQTTEFVKLTQTYRSTQQITDFTKGILPEGEAIDAFDREGDIPVVYLAKETTAMYQRLQEQLIENQNQEESTAIITKTSAEANELARRLDQDGIRVTNIQSENQRLAEGTIVVPSYLAKGLEFDAVIIWNAGQTNYHREDERQLLYTVASRAMHTLTILAEGQLTPLFDQVDQTLYELKQLN